MKTKIDDPDQNFEFKDQDGTDHFWMLIGCFVVAAIAACFAVLGFAWMISTIVNP